MLLHDLKERSDIGDQDSRNTFEYIASDDFKIDATVDSYDWLVARTEKFVQDNALYGGVTEAIAIMGEKDGSRDHERASIPGILQDALAVSFERKYVVNVSDLLKNYKSPEYLIEDLFKRGDLYSFTGATGSGKTAVALRLAWHVATGTNLGNRAVKAGRVIYFAGENPSDVTQRLAGMLEGIDCPIDLDVVPFAHAKVPNVPSTN
jgi:hypothetical protein